MEKLLFELASESRLSILSELRNENLKMQEVARRLDVTATEATRQLERLSTALLVRRQPDGTYAITEYGKLVLQLTSSLEFVSRHRDYFSTHDIMRIPPQFVSRICELSQTNLIMDTIESMNKAQRMFLEAEQFIWASGEGVIPENMGPAMDEKVRKGVELKFLIPKNRLPPNASPPETVKNVEIKSLSDLSAIFALTEKEAGIYFRIVGGRMDYVGFFGKDPTFRNWVKDLFLYYWNKGEQA